MKLSLATDYLGEVEAVAARMAAPPAHTFTHLHWCYHWNHAHHYTEEETALLRAALDRSGWGITDVHGAVSRKADWSSPDETVRRAGVALVENRLRFAAAIGADVVVMHPGRLDRRERGAWAAGVDPWREDGPRLAALLRSMEELTPAVARLGVRPAVENMESFAPIHALCDRFGPETVGLCYDSGHGHLAGDGLEQLAALRHRLLAVHLHDTDGEADRHWIPGRGAVDWPRLMALIADSSYAKWVNLEVSRRRSELSREAFIQSALAAAIRLHGLLETARAALPVSP